MKTLEVGENCVGDVEGVRDVPCLPVVGTLA